MKKIFLGMAFLFLFATLSNAQRGSNKAARQERVEAFKIAFFSEKLQLTPAESKTFWPLYNEFEQKREGLRDKYELKGKKIELLSDAEVKDYILNHLEMEDELVRMRKGYIMQFMDMLPVRKVAMLQRIDKEFKKALLQEMRKRRQDRRGGD